MVLRVAIDCAAGLPMDGQPRNGVLESLRSPAMDTRGRELPYQIPQYSFDFGEPGETLMTIEEVSALEEAMRACLLKLSAIRRRMETRKALGR